MRCWGLLPLLAVAKLVARLPQPLLLGLATCLSRLFWPLLAKRRNIARINLELCFPAMAEPERRALLAANQRDTVMGALEMLRAWFAPRQLVDPLLARIDGLQHLQSAIERGQGVLLLTAHFTPTELAARLLSGAIDRPLRGVVRRNNSECMEAMLESARRRVFGPTLEKKDLRGLLRALQRGDLVMYSSDQNFSYQSAFVPFFGVPAATLTSTPHLVRRGNAQMLAFWCHRQTDGRYWLRIEAPWPGWLCGTGEQAAAIYMRAVEAAVREHPSQYLWVHKRFKTRPPGAAPVY